MPLSTQSSTVTTLPWSRTTGGRVLPFDPAGAKAVVEGRGSQRRHGGQGHAGSQAPRAARARPRRECGNGHRHLLPTPRVLVTRTPLLALSGAPAVLIVAGDSW